MTEKAQCPHCPRETSDLDRHIMIAHPDEWAARGGSGAPGEGSEAHEAVAVADPDELVFGPSTLRVRRDVGPDDERHVPTWDPSYEFDAEVLEALAICAADDLPALLVGPKGCGKSSCVKNLAAALGQPLRRMNLHGDVRASDFLGAKVRELDEGTAQAVVRWRDGLVPDAMRRGHWLLLDEFDAAPAGILLTAQALLEPGHELVLADNHGELVRPERGGYFRIFATANTLGQGDESGLYAGTQIINDATLDRVLVIRMGYLKPDKEIEVIARKGGVGLDVAKKIVEVANLVRTSYESGGGVRSPMSTRQAIAWGHLIGRFGKGTASADVIRKAFRLAILNKADKEGAAILAGIAQRVFGGRMA